jgi:uncharacterized membrane protein
MSAARLLRPAGALVALAGAGISGYLTVVRLAGDEPRCAIAHGCAVVQSSRWAELAGVPVAVLGLGGYLAILVTLAGHGPRAREATALLALVGWGFSMWLTRVELVELHAVCSWCAGSALCMTLLAGLSVARALSAPEAARGAGARGASWRRRRAGRSPAPAPSAERRP